MKADLYTKIVLTVIAVALTANLIKDTDFVSKAQASEVINLSDRNVEKAEEEDITFFIYENSKIERPFSSDNTGVCKIGYKDIPTHIVTTKRIPFFSPSYEEIKKTR